MDRESPPFSPLGEAGMVEGDKNTDPSSAGNGYKNASSAFSNPMNGNGGAIHQQSNDQMSNGYSHHENQDSNNNGMIGMGAAGLQHSLPSFGANAERQHSFSSSLGEPHATERQHSFSSSTAGAPQSNGYDNSTVPNDYQEPQSNDQHNYSQGSEANPQQNENTAPMQANSKSSEGQKNSPPAPTPAPAPAPSPVNNEDDDIIELLDDDDDGNDATHPPQQQPSKRPRYANTGSVAIMPPSIGMKNSYAARIAALPNWMANNPNSAAAGYGGQPVNGYNHAAYNTGGYAYAQQRQPTQYSSSSYSGSWDPSFFDKPQYIALSEEFVPTWKKLIPDEIVAPPRFNSKKKAFSLSLLNLQEFTITGLPVGYDAPPTPIAGLRAVIKRMSREHGQATFEKDSGGVGGRWKIPLGAYHAFVAYLQSDPNCVRLEKIAEMQLKIASLGKARMEKDYPTAEKLMERGVPYALANTLAPFQRGGVDFVLDKDGRALIADDMGLGKTIQSIASMSVYHKQWPLLVLTPSGARYHWESEFRNWLGVNGAAVKKAEEEDSTNDQKKPAVSAGSILGGGNKTFNLLRDAQIHVLTNSKGKVLPNKNIRIVICSYGLAPMLAQNRQITPGMFQCAIADESHMMKNSKSKRTQCLLPILKACRRCILLSGTPALAKPAELWPQLQILASEKGFWTDEADFMETYVKRGNATAHAELHAMLKGTLMIRRLKDDILKDMPKKAREKAIIKVESQEMRKKMHECMLLLRQGKGVMAKLARQHSATTPSTLEDPEPTFPDAPPAGATAAPSPEQIAQSFHQLLNGARPIQGNSPAEAALEQEMVARYQQNQRTIHHALQTTQHPLSNEEVRNFIGHRDHRVRNELQIEYQERVVALHTNGIAQAPPEDERPTRATVLNKMYSLTGECKVPLVARFLKKWLADTTKGKICVFAHHITVLDAIAERVGMSNSGGPGTFKYIRIDGKTSPKSRQEQIDCFQTDATTRVALLGITAAGVAVTLTAASQVLFAELFWTPALMIQAEDRCHRIGQRAKVHCKYIVASGTLDDILWKLIEKKFRELGEFVEGKEKLKMIVHKVYKSEEELFKIFEYEDEEGDDEDEVLRADQVASDETVIPLDKDLANDIEKLAREEQAMLLGDRDEDDTDPDMTTLAAQQQFRAAPAVEDNGPGKSEEDAIALSDDEEEEEEEIEASAPLAVDPANPLADLNTAGTLPQSRIYKLVLQGPQLGVEVGHYKERLLVSRRLPSRVNRLGEQCKPDVGDILVAADTQVMPEIRELEPALKFLKKLLQRPQPLILYFAEDAAFKEHYKAIAPKKKVLREKKAPPPDAVVELLDD